MAACISTIHLAWILLVIFGVFFTRRRPFWTAVHLLSLAWGIIVEIGPWPCPLTMAEEYFQSKAGVQPLHGSYLLHCVDSVIYPNAPYWVIEICGVAVCAMILVVYAWRGWVWLRQRRA